MAEIGRRAFLGRSAAAAGAVFTTTTLQSLTSHAAWADGPRRSYAEPYGRLRPVAARNTGEHLLALPPGFRYAVLDQTGNVLADGTPSPVAFDGMGCFPHPSGDPHLVRLIRNSEVRTGPGAPEGRVLAGPDSSRYDPLGVAGCVTLDVDTRAREVTEAFVSINGTIVNCAGGLMLGKEGWLTCEETTAGPSQGWGQKHGYAFAVPLVGPTPGNPTPAVPIPAMGRFAHEAAAVDTDTGFVYETEDQSGIGNGLYRYEPVDPWDLAAGGTLSMLAITGAPGVDLRQGQVVDVEHPVEWVTIADPDPDLEGGAASVAAQGVAQGGARFNRLEGIWWGAGSIYFTSTSGGDVKNGDSPGADGYREGYGQIWKYTPSHESLRLLYQSNGASPLDSPDNLTITPSGALLLCEDDASSVDADTNALAPGITNINRLVGLTGNGIPFQFAVNIVGDDEFAGACYSQDGRFLFVNMFGDGGANPGRTLMIWGPWSSGPLG
jgi:uncharacterized protein